MAGSVARAPKAGACVQSRRWEQRGRGGGTPACSAHIRITLLWTFPNRVVYTGDRTHSLSAGPITSEPASETHATPGSSVAGGPWVWV